MLSLCTARRGHSLAQELAVVREMLDQLETKLAENDPDRVSKEDDLRFRGALKHIGDEPLTRSAMAYAICVRGLTAPMASPAWKQELAQEVEAARSRVVARLEWLARLSRFKLGHLVLRLKARVRRVFLRPPRPQPPISPEVNHHLHRPA